MNEDEPGNQERRIYTAAMLNVGISETAMISLAIPLQTGENLNEMFVILAGGTGLGIQATSSLSKLERELIQPSRQRCRHPVTLLSHLS